MFWNGDNYFTLLADRTGWTRGVAKCQQVKSKQREALSVSFGKGIAFDQEFVPVSRPQSGRTVLQQDQATTGGQLLGLNRCASPIQPLRRLKDRSLSRHGHKRGLFFGWCKRNVELASKHP